MLAEVAADALQAFEVIADSASNQLGQRPVGVDAFAALNEFNAASAMQNFGRIQFDLATACRNLQDEPAIARVVVADENGERQVVYVCRGTPVQCGVTLCSSLAPKGRLAALPVGDGATLRLPSGPRYFEVLEKATFKPVCPGGQWDSRNTVFRSESIGPLTIASLRELLAQAGVSENELDLLEKQLAEEDEAYNVVEGLRRSVLTAMQLRDQPILDQFQDEIFRLPLDSRLVILGPPGTGKTTTLVRRVRQKVDVQFLTEEEAALVETSVDGAPPHPQSWLMFTPTELLKQYVREAFAREGVPAPEQRIRTWADHRRELARRSLPILRSATGGTLVLNERDDPLQPGTINRQTDWFDDFDAFQSATFLEQIKREAETLSGSAEPAIARLGARATDLVSASDRPTAVLSSIVTLFDDLRRIATDLGTQVQRELRLPLAQHLKRDPGFLDDLAQFVSTLTAEPDDEVDEAEGDEDDVGSTPQQGRKAAQAAFTRAVRARAVAAVRKRAVPARGRNGRVLHWLDERSVRLPDLEVIGQTVVMQRAARRIVASPTGFVRGLPRQYRRFRRDRTSAGAWYVERAMAPNEVSPLELDVILLAMLRNARSLLTHSNLMRRLGDRAPQILTDIKRLQRNQVLVDEATDFSPIQLACMAALARPETDSFFACGDFNQRLTIWGSSSPDDLQWTFPDIEIREIDVAYRQSRKLNELATRLASSEVITARARLPEDLANEGVAPVFGGGLDSPEKLVPWLSSRIREIEEFTGQLPSIAILVNDAAMLHPLAQNLNEALAARNIKAVPCPDGQVMGQENDVRVFEVEHIKGLEFEAVFFVDVDELERRQPELFDKYLYVGATRAATYLGVTCSASELPNSLSVVADLFAEHW